MASTGQWWGLGLRLSETLSWGGASISLVGKEPFLHFLHMISKCSPLSSTRLSLSEPGANLQPLDSPSLILGFNTGS